MIRIFKFVFFVLIVGLLSPQASYAKDLTFNWNKSSNNVLRSKAADYFSGDDFPKEKSQVLSQVDIKVSKGKVIKRVKNIIYYPSFNETHNDGNKYIYWDKEVEDLVIYEAAVINSNNDYKRIKEDNVRVLDSSTYNTFIDDKEVVIPFSGLSNHVVVILEYELVSALIDYESDWADGIYPVFFETVEEFKFSFMSDDKSYFRWANNNENVLCEEVKTTLSCSANNLKPYKSDSGVIWRDTVGAIYVGGVNRWDDVISQIKKIFDRVNTSNGLVTKTLNSMLSEDDDIETKIEKIFKFVSRDVRYISLSELGHRVTPHKPDDVIENRFGDCKDKSTLLVRMLNEIGINATPVLVATQRKKVDRLLIPSSSYFDHMVVCFDFKGRRYCLDPTDSSTNWKSISYAIQGKVSLALAEHEAPKLIPENEFTWRLNVDTYLSFSSDGTQTETQTRTYTGEYAGQLRSTLFGLNDEDISKWATTNYQSNVSSTAEPKFEFIGIDEMANQAQLKSTVSYPPFLDTQSNMSYAESDAWIKQELKNTKVATEHYDTSVNGIQIESRVTIDFEGLWRFGHIPPRLKFESEYASMIRGVRVIADDKIVIKTTVKIPGQVIKNAQIKSFNEHLSLLMRESGLSMTGYRGSK